MKYLGFFVFLAMFHVKRRATPFDKTRQHVSRETQRLAVDFLFHVKQILHSLALGQRNGQNDLVLVLRFVNVPSDSGRFQNIERVLQGVVK